ncbi:hypothetical protein MRX96_012407 [Rhipicephalus microplus]
MEMRVLSGPTGKFLVPERMYLPPRTYIHVERTLRARALAAATLASTAVQKRAARLLDGCRRCCSCGAPPGAADPAALPDVNTETLFGKKKGNIKKPVCVAVLSA